MADIDTKVFDWDDEIQNDDNAFLILPEGNYDFTVTNFERGKFPGSEKIPPCNKAIITLETKTDEGTAITTVDFILASVLEWKISSFFTCIGMKKRNEKFRMNWKETVGKKGIAHFKPRTWTGKDGIERKSNDVKEFYAPLPLKRIASDEEDLPF